MQVKKKTTPAILADTNSERWIWRLKIRARDQWADMLFSNRVTAEQEFQNYRNRGTFGGLWIDEITLVNVVEGEHGRD